MDTLDAHVEHLPAPLPLNIIQILRPQQETPAPTPHGLSPRILEGLNISSGNICADRLSF